MKKDKRRGDLGSSEHPHPSATLTPSPSSGEGLKGAIRMVIQLPPVTKKNSQRIVYRGRHPIILPSEKYEQYESNAGWFIKPLGIDYPVNIRCLYYMATKRIVDLVNLQEATLDVLVKYGAIKDDNSRIVVSMDGSRVLYDKENPRTEIYIERV